MRDRRVASQWTVGRRSRAVARTAVMALVVTAVPASPAVAAALPTWPANPNWQSLVPGPSSDDLRPVTVVRTHGSVTNAGALTGQGGGSTVLTMAPGGPQAIVVLDYGKEVGGTPYVRVASQPAGSLDIRISTSEALTFLNTNKTTTLSSSAGSGATNVRVASVAPFWGAGPTQILTESVLGATAVDAGYTEWRVKPQPADLAWAQGQVPTRTGSLTVRWAQDAARHFHLQVDAPTGTGGEVWVPLATPTGTSTALTPAPRCCGAAATTTCTAPPPAPSSSAPHRDSSGPARSPPGYGRSRVLMARRSSIAL